MSNTSVFAYPERVTPEYHIWVQYQLSWLKLADDLPSYKQQRTPRADLITNYQLPINMCVFS
jgi:hypothetical protein